jgi:hypothetical protein
MALEESQDCSRVARGWSRSLFLVLLSYAFKEALKIGWKLEEEDAIGENWDMGCGSDSKLMGAGAAAARGTT